MEKEKRFKVGDKIIHFGQVYKIFKTRGRGKDKVVFFRRYFKSKKHRKLVFSIPINSIDKTKIRKPFSKKKLKNLFKALGQKLEIKTINIVKIKKQLKSSNSDENVEILNRLWQVKKSDPDHFSKTKKDALKLVMKKLSEEIAFVFSISLHKARKKIKAALEKSKNVG